MRREILDMKQMKTIKYILIFVAATLANTIVAQNFVAQASKTRVAVGETFQISFTLNTNGSGFKAPSLADFEVYGGPNQSSNVTFVNGSMSQSISLSYILAPKKEGKFTIGPASISTSNGVIRSNALTIEVSKGTSNLNNQNNAQNNGQSITPPTNQELSDNLYIKTYTSKSKVYLGEEVTVTFKLYTRIDVVQLNVTSMPSCDGFYLQEGKVSNQTTENIDGVNYLVAELRKSFMIPLKTGKLTIDPLEIECVVRQQSRKRSRDIFDQIFGSYENASVKIKSKPISIEVMALPEENKPANFSGAVGNYSVKSQLNKNKIKANESLNLTIEISGKGNIKLVDPLKVTFPEDFEAYDPKSTEKISAGATGITGSKKFDYLFIPRYPGEYTIDNIGFNYFDPEKKQYITIPSSSFPIHVDKGDSNANTTSVYNPKNKEEVKVLGTDIRYIKTNDLELHPKNNLFFGTFEFYAALLSPLVVFIGFIVIRKKKIEENKDMIAVKSRKANKMAKKRLVIADKHIKTNNKNEFYIEISKALFGYLSDKLNLPTADLTQSTIAQILKERNVSPITISQLMETIHNCEYAKYAPSTVSGDLNAIYSKTVELITNIEHELK